MVRQEEEFLVAFNQHSDALFRHAFFRLSDRDRALELTQDAFLKAWDYIRAGGEVRQFKSFLYRILNNLIVDEYRRVKQESLDELLDDEERSESSLGLAQGGLEEKMALLEEEALVTTVRENMAKLPEDYRVAVTLRFMDGFSPKEIAKIVGTSENVVSVRIHRAIVKLRALCAS